MKHIESKIWKAFQYEINTNRISLATSESVWFINIGAGLTKKVIDDTINTINKKVLDKTMAMYQIQPTKIMIGAVSTPEEVFAWQEALVAKEMEALLEIQKQVLAKKQALVPVLKALVQAQKDLPATSPYKNKYTANSFDGL